MSFLRYVRAVRDRQTDRQTPRNAHRNTPLSYRGDEKGNSQRYRQTKTQRNVW